MGDRGNIIIRQEAGTNKGDVWFYTHWSGSNIPAVVQRALKRKQRWDDPAYLARIIFCELIDSDVKGETGFGISTGMCDNEHDLILVDIPNKTVAILKSDACPVGDTYEYRKYWSFDAFIKLETLPEV